MKKRFIIIDAAYKNEGLRFYENECPTLNARDYKEPRLVIDETLYNTIQSGYITNNQGGVEIL